jgi:integrase/recombinase XerD
VNLAQAIDIYVEQKHLAGMAFLKGRGTLTSLSFLVGNIPIGELQPRQVLSFLNGPRTSTVTWRAKYGILRQFFFYWFARDEMTTLPLPLLRPPVIQTFVPYIYTRAELHRLLAATRISQRKKVYRIDTKTLRTFMLFLYATGALISEARRLRCKDIDFRRKQISLFNHRTNQSRTIPIGEALCQILKTYQVRAHGAKPQNETPFFVTTNGEILKEPTLHNAFQRARAISGVMRSDGAQYQPRMQDLRPTFATHRVTSWLRHGADMNRMMPALAVYLGLVGLGSTEKYLKMTPERFKTQLNILCPNRSKKRWRDNTQLMRFVDAL